MAPGLGMSLVCEPLSSDSWPGRAAGFHFGLLLCGSACVSQLWLIPESFFPGGVLNLGPAGVCVWNGVGVIPFSV